MGSTCEWCNENGSLQQRRLGCSCLKYQVQGSALFLEYLSRINWNFVLELFTLHSNIELAYNFVVRVF